ncbi:hypothetical protein ACE193_25460 (plasmid) [Bernardetia sp. OM2101]|uniref:hypothetical protein n=1 Tax=Bernardetia sp. OM2101 TaxID=3344876 RepID=UPI0035CFB6FB
MSRITWKENKVISIKLKAGIYAIAQMIKSPYLVFFDLFKDDSNWDDVDLTNTPILFIHGVTRQFIKKSEVEEVKITPVKRLNIPNHWIYPDAGARKVTVWEGTEFEKEFITLGRMGASLVEKDILKEGKYDHPSGVFDKVLIKSIDNDDSETINNHELTSVEIYPNLNERLYLCYKLGKNVDPQKDLLFDKDLPKEYKTYIDIISGKVQLSELGY